MHKMSSFKSRIFDPLEIHIAIQNASRIRPQIFTELLTAQKISTSRRSRVSEKASAPCFEATFKL